MQQRRIEGGRECERGLTVSEASQRTGLSRSRLYQLVRSGRVGTVASEGVTMLREDDVVMLSARTGALLSALTDLGGTASDVAILDHAARAGVVIAPQALRHLARASGVLTHLGPAGGWRFTLPVSRMAPSLMVRAGRGTVRPIARPDAGPSDWPEGYVPI